MQLGFLFIIVLFILSIHTTYGLYSNRFLSFLLLGIHIELYKCVVQTYSHFREHKTPIVWYCIFNLRNSLIWGNHIELYTCVVQTYCHFREHKTLILWYCIFHSNRFTNLSCPKTCWRSGKKHFHTYLLASYSGEIDWVNIFLYLGTFYAFDH